MIGYKHISLSQTDPILRHTNIFHSTIYVPFGSKAYDYRIFYVLEGSAVMKIDGIEYHACRGTLLMWPPGIGYSLIVKDAPDSRILTMNFDMIRGTDPILQPVPPDNEEIFDPAKMIAPVLVNELNADHPVLSVKVSADTERLLLRINNEFVTGKNFYSDKVRGYLIILFSTLASDLLTGQKSGEMVSQIDIDNILDHLRNNFSSEMSNEMVGKHFSFHPNYISRVVRKATGMPLHKYLIRLRVSEAVNLLQTTGMSISEIAESTGFSGINYFSRCFKKFTGSTPGSFRR